MRGNIIYNNVKNRIIKIQNNMKTLNLNFNAKWLLVVAFAVMSAQLMRATDPTYKLTAVTSVEDDKRYVLVENGNALVGTISSSKLQSTTSFNTTGLTGSETYIWELDATTGGFYLKNVSVGSSGYLRNSSQANLALTTSDQTNNVWTFTFSVSTAQIQVGSRYLTRTSTSSTEYKAYSTIPTGVTYDFTIYRVDEEVSTTHTVTWNDNSGQLKSESIAEGSTSYSCPASNPSTSAPNCGDKFMGWTNTTNYIHGTSPLFTDDSGSKPAINADTDFYAVFADEVAP